jgi:ketosteroid isomerase-like protein
MASSALQTVQAAYEAFGRRDVPRIFSLLAPEIEITQSTELPWGGVYRGHEGARQFFGKLTASITSAVTLERFIESGDHVIAIGWTQGTVNATGAAFRVPIAHVWKVAGGAVVQIQFYIDNPTMLAALAGRPPSDGA